MGSNAMGRKSPASVGESVLGIGIIVAYSWNYSYMLICSDLTKLQAILLIFHQVACDFVICYLTNLQDFHLYLFNKLEVI